MGKIDKPNKPLYIILSIILACTVWLYVMDAENMDADKTLNVRVTFVGEEVLGASNLMISKIDSPMVTLVVQGKRNTLAQINRDNVTIRVDVSKIVEPGDYSLAYEITYPSNVSRNDVSTRDRNPFYVGFTVAKLTKRTVPVRGISTGSVAEGYLAGEFVINPATVEISGQELLVAQVDYALVTLNREGLHETFREDMSYELIGYNGEPVMGLDVVCTPGVVDVILPVVMLREVPLTVHIAAGGGATEENVTYTITPSQIWVSGDEDDLLPLNEIILGTIDLSKLISSDTYTFPIPLPPELTNVSGVSEASVQVRVTGLETKTLETDNIEIINAPEGYQAIPVTQSVQVFVRGTEETLELVLPQHIRVVADLKDATLPTGQSLVPVKVYLDGGSGAGIVGEYKIAIQLMP